MVTATKLPLPLLENGDRLTRPEFERRYEAMPNLKKAELIEGIVFMAAALRANNHGNPHAIVMTWLGVYYAATPGTYLADNTTVRLDMDNAPQPDALLRIEPVAGGKSRITEDDRIEGAPELVVEVAASSASYDMNAKLNVYRRSGVQEYIVWQIYENQILWYQLVEGQYEQLESNSEGIVESQIFPGLILPLEDMQSRDIAEVLAQLQTRLGSAAHKAYIQKLKVN